MLLPNSLYIPNFIYQQKLIKKNLRLGPIIKKNKHLRIFAKTYAVFTMYGDNWYKCITVIDWFSVVFRPAREYITK